jgi:hypothetical protein
MTSITQARLRSQCLAGNPLAAPEEVVRRLGAVQSQDFGPGKWSIAQRTTGASEGDLDRAFAEGAILRTHILRPTWHFVLPEDIRWMLELTAPRVQMQSAAYYRNQGLDAAQLERCTALLVRCLEGGRHRTRKEIAIEVEQAGIPTTPLRLGFILMNAELNGVICNGPPRGKQQTYALLEERAPRARRLDREEALAELALRYFTGHGPATVQDLRWWSSLTLADIKRGIEMAGTRLEQEEIDGVSYWFSRTAQGPESAAPSVHLLQGYDEYIVGYGGDKHLIDESGMARSLPRPRGIYTHAVLLDGQLAGTWKAAPKKESVRIEVSLFAPFDEAQTQALEAAVARYGEFLRLTSSLAVLR